LQGISSLREQCAEAHIVELERLQELDRLQREEQERLRLEEEERKRQAEEQERLRREEERKKAEEEERLRLEEEERARLQREEEERRLREEAERLRQEEEERRQREEEERQREEAERLRREEEVRLRREHEERLQREKEERLRLEAEAKAQEERRQHDEEIRRLQKDQERLQRELDCQREEAERLRQEELERKRREEEENERRDQLAELDWQRQQDYDDRARVDHDDASISEFFCAGCFLLLTAPDSNGVRFPGSASHESSSRTTANRLLAELEALRIPFIAEPSESGTLPSGDDVRAVQANFKKLDAHIVEFLGSVRDDESDEVSQLRAEHQRCSKLLLRLDVLGTFSGNVLLCDNSLSDLLEHIDSYPTAPITGLAASHRSDPRQLPKDQLELRITFTKNTLEDLQAVFNKVSDDLRAVGEMERINQTWTELYDMGTDCLSGGRSPAPSVVDSLDSASSTRSRPIAAPPVPLPRKAGNISLGHGRPSQPQLLASRRTASKGAMDLSRPTSKMSMRSASGPLAVSSNVFKPTFSSRQRTTSTSSQISQAQPGQRDVSGTLPRSTSRTGRRVDSSSTIKPQEAPRSTFSRAPRFSTASQTSARPKPKRKTYVPNTKSKLDVAVGDVLNKLPEDIAVHMEPVGWQDNSGKYWIGDTDPKLCFCRILRSQTVMVRVGGGWMELSR